MNFQYQTAAEAVLSDILARDPRASLHDIRQSHPSLRRLSPDALALRVGRVLERCAVHSLK